MTAEDGPGLSAAEPLESAREDATMDVHKPKPVHSWREFLSEIGVIVIGVAIALAGEQAVEAIHWHHVVEAQREALRGGIADNLAAVKIRSLQQPCVDARLAQLAIVFERHNAGEPLGLKGRVGRPQNASAGDEPWQLAVQSDALNHMPLAERATLADAYSNFTNLANIRNEADRAWIDLGALDKPDLLREDDWAALRRSYGQVVAIEARVKDVDDYVLTTKTVGVAIPEVAKDYVFHSDYAKDFCKPLV